MPGADRARSGDFMVAAGALSALVAVAAGAFGAHMLKVQVTSPALQTFETAARYQMYHAMALLFAGRFVVRRSSGVLLTACWMFLLGTLLFSGSLYGLALTEQRWLGTITPVGGALFLLGWLCLGVGALRRGHSRAASD
jgi:uncharacterized membrane protein YgdD (TMEM256/DUF423 family)